MLAAGDASEADAAVRELRPDIEAWRIGLEKAFNNWSFRPEAQPASDLKRGLKIWVAALETRVAEIVDNLRGQVSEEEGQRFYQLLGSYRGVSEAALEYARASDSIDWGEWREEKFS